jgi:hypothetical protein
LDWVLLFLRILLAALLYGFLGFLLLMLWRDLRHTVREREVAPPQGRLVLVDAAKTGLEPGLAFPLQEVTPLGRTPVNAIALPDPFVSTHHALLAWREARWWLEDLNSKNGTTLNGEPVTRPVVVSGGDLIGVGRVKLRLEVEG